VSNRLVPLILAVALFMENMDSTVIATSLAAIADDIGTQPIALKLALTSYLVALGGGVLEGLRLTHGGAPVLGDFHIAFYVIAAVALVSTVMFAFLPRTAGRHLTGHGRAAVGAAE
jgi:hypothetical protein